MKVIKALFAIAVLLGCTVLPVWAVLAYEAHKTSDLTAEIIARAPEKGNFTPREVTVKVGQKVKLRVRNVDCVAHGFTLPGLDVDAGEIKAGHVVVLEFTPEKTGEFPFYCTVWCSEQHLQMRGILKVID